MTTMTADRQPSRTEMGRARRAAEEAFLRLRQRQAAIRAGQGQGDGDRPTPGLGRRAVELVEITEARPEGGVERITALGRKTARTKLPRALSRYPAGHARRRAAEAYAAACEALAATNSATSFLMAPTGGGATSDGGAVARLRIAARVRTLASVIASCQGLEPLRGGAIPINARTLVDDVCLNHKEFAEVLRAHGWSASGRNLGLLRDCFGNALDALAHHLELV